MIQSKENRVDRKKPGGRGIFNLYNFLLIEFLKVLDYFVIKSYFKIVKMKMSNL